MAPTSIKNNGCSFYHPAEGRRLSRPGREKGRERWRQTDGQTEKASLRWRSGILPVRRQAVPIWEWCSKGFLPTILTEWLHELAESAAPGTGTKLSRTSPTYDNISAIVSCLLKATWLRLTRLDQDTQLWLLLLRNLTGTTQEESVRMNDTMNTALTDALKYF